MILSGSEKPQMVRVIKSMIQLNPQYEAIFDARNIDDEGCE